jgi:opacity protein-like surface antigen
MTLRILAAAAGLVCTLPALAVDFGVMETADTVIPGDFKFLAFPLAVRDGPRREVDTGINVGIGYGISEPLDVEFQIGVYDDFNFFGLDLEYSYREKRPLELSIGGGVHKVESDFGYPYGFDLTHIASYTFTSLPTLRFIAALDGSYEVADAYYAASIGARDKEYWTGYAVPGLQFRVNERVDLIGEAGIGLNDDSQDYVALGLSFYFTSDPVPYPTLREPASGGQPSARR